MATNTSLSFLMYKASTTYTKLVDIKSYPNIMGEREALETTTLSNTARTYIPGIVQSSDGNLAFPANYDEDDFATVAALEGTEQDLAIWFGGTVSGSTVTPTGSEGKFEFKGFVSAGIVGKGVNEVREMEVRVTPTTEITVASS